MDSKIILAILIVALIGIVAATYQNETSDAINALTSVATEEGVTDSVDTLDDISTDSDSANSIKVDEDIVRPDTGISNSNSNSKNNQKQEVKASTSTSTSASSASQNSGSKVSNGATNNNQGTTTKQNIKNTTVNSNKTTNTNTTTNYAITTSRAEQIALSNLPSEYQGATAVTTFSVYNNVPQYMVKCYKNNEFVAYYVIDAQTGSVIEGAMKGEA